MSLLGGGLVGGMLTKLATTAGNSLLSSDNMNVAPIPAFYFEVIIYDPASWDDKKSSLYKGESDSESDSSGKKKFNIKKMAKSAGNSLKNAAKNFVSIPAPGDFKIHKSFIEVSGLEMGLEGKKTFNEGGYNFPIDLPDKMKNSAVTFKRLIRPATLTKDDLWTSWCDETFQSMAYWETPIKTKVIQINVMHPNLGTGGKPIMMYSANLFDAYPSKKVISSLNSTSEDLMVEEIEVSYSSMFASYDGKNSTLKSK